MPKTAAISARIDPHLKENAEQVFSELGITASQAIALFYRQVELHQGLPFKVELPNKRTKQALEEARERRNLGEFATIDALFEDLGV